MQLTITIHDDYEEEIQKLMERFFLTKNQLVSACLQSVCNMSSEEQENILGQKEPRCTSEDVRRNVNFLPLFANTLKEINHPEVKYVGRSFIITSIEDGWKYSGEPKKKGFFVVKSKSYSKDSLQVSFQPNQVEKLIEVLNEGKYHPFVVLLLLDQYDQPHLFIVDFAKLNEQRGADLECHKLHKTVDGSGEKILIRYRPDDIRVLEEETKVILGKRYESIKNKCDEGMKNFLSK